MGFRCTGCPCVASSSVPVTGATGTILTRPMIGVPTIHSLASLLAFNQSQPAYADQVWGTNNLAIYVPFRLDYPATATGLWWFPNTAANLDEGIFDENGTKLVSTGSVVGAGGTRDLQLTNVANTVLSPGRYWWGLSCDNAAAQMEGRTFLARTMRMVGCYQELAAFPLPAVATFATFAQAFVPEIGMYIL